MARSIALIQAQIIAEKTTQTALAGLTSTSQTAIWRLLIFIQAVAINIFEQAQDLFKVEIETLIDSAPAGTDAWIRKKMFEFQYSATTPQVVVLNNYAPTYDPIDENLRIITRCSVKTAANKTVNVKIAVSDPPAAASGPQLTAAQGYLNNSGSSSALGHGIGFAGVQYNVVSYSPDLVYIGGNIKYDGQYSATIQTAVIAAINDYFANIEFDGEFVINKMIDYIQAVPGVIDTTFNDIAIRPATVAFPGYTYLVQSNYYGMQSYPLFAGYCVGETQAGNTLTDTLTFTAV